MSSMYSGRTHLRIDDEKQDRADRRRQEADEAELAVGQFGQAAERLTPGVGSEQGEESFEHEHQCTRGQEGFRHGSFLRPGRYFGPGRGEPLPTPDCFRYW